MKYRAQCPHCGELVQWEVQKNVIVRDDPSLMYNASTGNIEPVGGCKEIYRVTNNRRSYEVYPSENQEFILSAPVTCPHCKKEFRSTRIIDRPMTYQERFRKIIKEMQADWQRYNAFNPERESPVTCFLSKHPQRTRSQGRARGIVVVLNSLDFGLMVSALNLKKCVASSN